MPMYEKIPEELKRLPNWVCWRGERSEEGKLRKIPVNPRTGGGAMSNNPETWTDFETAVRASEQYSGVGFMFAPPYFGVDIDNVGDAIEQFKKGGDRNIIAEFVHTLCSYTEYSQSGNGIHIICRGQLPEGGRRKKNVEMYQTGRYFIMTGNDAAGYAEIVDCTEAIKPLHEKYIGGGKKPTTGIQPVQTSLSDKDILELAMKSRQGQTVRDLYAGSWEGYFGSQSEADMSFCSTLAFWCGRNVEQMDRIFRSSGLMRDKWDRRQSGSTYGALTLKKAVQSCKRVYEPPVRYGVSIGTSRPIKLYSLDDMGNAERLTETFAHSIRYCYVNKCWYYYDSRKWVVDQSGYIGKISDEVVEAARGSLPDYLKNTNDPDDMEKQFNKHIKYSRSHKGKRAMIEEAMHHVPILPSEMDRCETKLNTPNGIVNLENGSLEAHSYASYLTKITSCEYTDKTDCPRWEAFLDEIFAGDKELIRYIQKAVGYSLSGSTQEQCAFFCYGNGRNGKSTFLDVISFMLGDYAINIQPETIMVKRGSSSSASSDVARLKGARFVTSVEPDEGMRLNEGLVKQLTGGDRVTARYLYGNEFEFKPEFKLWMGTNHKPIIRGTDMGIWRRIHLVPFTVTIPEEKADKHLLQKLTKELPGILKWAVEGCLMWQREGLKQPKVVEDATKEYRSEMDVVSAFLSDCCTVGSGREKSSDLYQAYTKWADQNNEYKMSNRRFGRELAKQFANVKSHGVMCFDGVTLNSYNITIGQ